MSDCSRGSGVDKVVGVSVVILSVRVAKRQGRQVNRTFGDLLVAN